MALIKVVRVRKLYELVNVYFIYTMKNTIIFGFTLLLVACGPGEKELKLYNDQKSAVESQIKTVQSAEQLYTECVKTMSPDSCQDLKKKFEMEVTFLSNEIDALSNYGGDGAIKNSLEEIKKYRDLNNAFAEKLK